MFLYTQFVFLPKKVLCKNNVPTRRHVIFTQCQLKGLLSAAETFSSIKRVPFALIRIVRCMQKLGLGASRVINGFVKTVNAIVYGVTSVI
jgi:hypothetical protein